MISIWPSCLIKLRAPPKIKEPVLLALLICVYLGISSLPLPSNLVSWFYTSDYKHWAAETFPWTKIFCHIIYVWYLTYVYIAWIWHQTVVNDVQTMFFTWMFSTLLVNLLIASLTLFWWFSSSMIFLIDIAGVSVKGPVLLYCSMAPL